VGQFTIRPGISYRMSDSPTLWGGYAYFYTDARNGGSVNEHRAWQLLSWTIMDRGRTCLKSRTRLEQRFVNEASGTGLWIRQQFRLDHRLPNREDVRFVIGAEAFFHLRDTSWAETGYTQGRFFAGLGFDSVGRGFEVGYLHQHNQTRLLPDLSNHLLVLVFKL
jgi:hypothetical protein